MEDLDRIGQDRRRLDRVRGFAEEEEEEEEEDDDAAELDSRRFFVVLVTNVNSSLPLPLGIAF